MNARSEFLEHTESLNILCAHMDVPVGNETRTCVLRTGFSDVDLEAFLTSIDVEYDNGYGSQQVFGEIWYTDGSWSERGEYDGSEWWDWRGCPSIPEMCLGDKVRIVRRVMWRE